MKRIPARFQSGTMKGQGYIKNVSKGGLFLRTDELPDPGAPVHVLFLDREQQKVEVSGTVRWTTDQFPDVDAPRGFGILFDTTGDNFMDFYESMLLS